MKTISDMYDIKINLPDGWQKESEVYEDESGEMISHLEAHNYDHENKTDLAMMDIYVGTMPEDTTAEDQAFSNYADMVGFSDDDPEGFEPIEKFKFNGRNAFGFSALCEDDSPMRFISVELKKDVLAIICIAAKDEDSLAGVFQIVERNLRLAAREG